MKITNFISFFDVLIAILEIKDDLDKLNIQYFYLGDNEPKIQNARPLSTLMKDSPSTEPHTLKNTSCHGN